MKYHVIEPKGSSWPVQSTIQPYKIFPYINVNINLTHVLQVFQVMW